MFIRSSMCNNMYCIVKSDRVLAVKVHNCSVYFPVFRSSPEYESEISGIVGVIDTILLQIIKSNQIYLNQAARPIYR